MMVTVEAGRGIEVEVTEEEETTIAGRLIVRIEEAGGMTDMRTVAPDDLAAGM